MEINTIKELNALSENELEDLQTRFKISSDMRVHMSKNPIYSLEKINYVQKPGPKPKGFWYGFGDKWIDWIKTEMPEWKGEYIYEVDISDSKILQIKNYLELKEFTQEYKLSEQIIPGTIYLIDWNRVAFKYDGIEINPYIRRARLELLWYYGWDVASGVVWNLDKAKIKLVGLLKDEVFII